MLDYLYRARWDQAYAFLGSGDPPVYVRLIALNALFVAIYAVRRALGSPPMTGGRGLFAQAVIAGGNLFILYQQEVQNYLLALMGRG